MNRKVRGHQEEANQLREKVRDTERLREKEEEEIQSQLYISQQRVRIASFPLLSSLLHLCSSTYPLQVKALMESIGQLNSDLEAVKQTHKIDAERRSQAGVLLHSQLEQNKSELSQIQNRLESRELEVAELKGTLSEAKTQQQMATGRVSLIYFLSQINEMRLDILSSIEFSTISKL